MSALGDHLIDWAEHRQPHFIIHVQGKPYLRRWWLIPRNRFFNIYLHQILRSDDDRALHDHPWWNLSIVLEGGYLEHTIAAGGIHKKRWRGPGSWVFRRARSAHRLELLDHEGCWSLFITGPRLRKWGFHYKHGWVNHEDIFGPGYGGNR